MNVPSLVAITPGDGRAMVPWIAALAQAGLPGLCLREAPGTDVLPLLRAARDVPWLAVHTRCLGAHSLAELEATVGRPLALHLRDDHQAAPPAGMWSRSTHSVEGAQLALIAGAHHVWLSPIWPPSSKADDHRPCVGAEAYLSLSTNGRVLALGGITPSRHRLLRGRGGPGSAVLGGLFKSAHPCAAAELLRHYLDTP